MYSLSSRVTQPRSILHEEFPLKFRAFNELTREICEAGITIKQLVLIDNKIFIEPASIQLILLRFGHEVRGIRYSAAGRFTRNAVTVKGVDIA